VRGGNGISPRLHLAQHTWLPLTLTLSPFVKTNGERELKQEPA